jgi:transcription antitermination factor NusG
MSEFIKIEGHSDLLRDANSKAIINTNMAAYEAAVKRSKAVKQQKDDLRDAVRDINILKNQIKEIRSLLIKMVENKNGKS